MKKVSEYIRFVLWEKKPKTEVYAIVNETHDVLGYIKWHPKWRQYCFFSEEIGSIFNIGCMRYIIDFIQKLMEERKKLREINSKKIKKLRGKKKWEKISKLL